MRTTILILPLIAAAACSAPAETEAFYLYRSAYAGDPHDSIYIAAFNSGEGRAYNEENCMIVRGLMDRQPGSTVGYWCSQTAP